MIIFVIFILPIHEHGRLFYIVMSSSISFFNVLKFLLYKSFACFLNAIPRYTLLLGFLSLFLFCFCHLCIVRLLSFVYLYPATLLKVFISCKKFPDGVFRFYFCCCSSIMKGCCFLSKALSASSEIIILFLPFSLFLKWIMFIDLGMLTIPVSLG